MPASLHFGHLNSSPYTSHVDTHGSGDPPKRMGTHGEEGQEDVLTQRVKVVNDTKSKQPNNGRKKNDVDESFVGLMESWELVHDAML